MSEAPLSSQVSSVLDQLDQLEEIVLDGTRVPFSGGRLVNEQDAIELMDAVREALPGQLSQAEALVRQKEEFISTARHTRIHLARLLDRLEFSAKVARENIETRD